MIRFVHVRRKTTARLQKQRDRGCVRLVDACVRVRAGYNHHAVHDRVGLVNFDGRGTPAISLGKK
jgi:hypothetical protein